ncbi:hypothetical protein [Klebsiella pneumoniae IS39]|nr:hypothetical protein [Klebsiella pneumoniae IS39]
MMPTSSPICPIGRRFMAEGVIQRFFDREALVNGEHRMR